jgi:phosphomannomutase
MNINPSIFRAYDVRGKYPEELNEEAVYKIAQAFVRYLKAKKILVGRDARTSSEDLFSSLVRGINSQGAVAVDAGLCGTPAFYFAAAKSDADAGLLCTASHLGKEFNGLKPVLAKNVPLTREQINELKNVVMNENFRVVSEEEKIVKQDFNQAYVEKIKEFIKDRLKPLKIVIDASNGMAGLYVEKVFSGTGLQVVPMFTEIDGSFPNHAPNPKIPANRQKLVDRILAEKADLGVMFDGDGDRVYLLDRQGRVIEPSLVSALIGEYLIKKTGRKKILVEVRTSRVVKDFAEKVGGRAEVSVCWTIPMKLKMMKDHEIIFGSETSGHYVFADFYRIDDGILAALNFIQAISVKKESIDEILQDFRAKYFVIEEKNFEIKNAGQANEVLKTLEKGYKKQDAKIVKIDGLTVQFPDWWFNLRTSESEPLLRLNLEAKTKELMEEKKKEVSSLVDNLTQKT